MTDKEKLQQLFAAALQDSSRLDKPPTRAFPESKISKASSLTLPVRPLATPAPEPIAPPVTDASVAAAADRNSW